MVPRHEGETVAGTAGGRTAPAAAQQQQDGGSGSADELVVLSAEQPWTGSELAQVSAELLQEQSRLRQELADAEQQLLALMREGGEGAGDDQADAGAATWEREHELSLANNAKDLLEQNGHALARIAESTYGICESCENAIGKMRLQAFPRATLCLPCKRHQERR